MSKSSLTSEEQGERLAQASIQANAAWRWAVS